MIRIMKRMPKNKPRIPRVAMGRMGTVQGVPREMVPLGSRDGVKGRKER
jgi:hypothetical protein